MAIDVVTLALAKKYTDKHAVVLDSSTTQETVEQYLKDNADIFVSPEELAAYHDSSKQNTITDLDTIREGASKGATAIQSLDGYTTNEELNTAVGIINQKITNVELTTNKVISFENNTTDEQYPSAKLVQDSLNGKQNKLTDTDKQAIANLRVVPTKTSELNNDSGYLTSNDIKDLANKNEIPKKLSELTNDLQLKTINSESIIGDGNIVIDTCKVADVQVNGASVVKDKIATINFSDATMGRDFTTDITVGHLISGTVIKATDKIADILYQILYQAVSTLPTKVQLWFGVSDNVPTSLDDVSNVSTIQDLDPDELLNNGYIYNIKAGNADTEEGQYPVIACSKTIKLIKLDKWYTNGAEDLGEYDVASVELPTYNLYYITTKSVDGLIGDMSGITYKFTFAEA